MAAGLTRGVIDYLLQCGFIHRLFRGVYVVGHLALAPFARQQAALFACGEGAVISHRSAVHMWGLMPVAPTEVDITPRRHCRPKAGIRVHRTPPVRRDIRRRHGLPVTSPARALIEFAADAAPQELEDAVAEARVSRLIRPGELEQLLTRAGRARGATRMRAFLDSEASPTITRSIAERRFLHALREAGLPPPRTNVRIAGCEVDFVWEPERVIVEVDGWRFHGHRQAFERDRKKSMMLSDAGYHVSRVTWRQFTAELLFVIAHVARALDRRARAAG